jgi:hypothetical protein
LSELNPLTLIFEFIGLNFIIKKMIPTFNFFRSHLVVTIWVLKQSFGLWKALKALIYYSFFDGITQIALQKHFAINNNKILLILEKKQIFLVILKEFWWKRAKAGQLKTQIDFGWSSFPLNLFCPIRWSIRFTIRKGLSFVWIGMSSFLNCQFELVMPLPKFNMQINPLT